jgi:hypothetical protein
MNAVAWMTAASLGSWLAASAVSALATTSGAELPVDLLAGMLGPLAVAATSWVAAERTYRRSPERLTAMMVAAFGVKMVFFGAYVAFALKVLSLRPIPFVISFTGYFVGLHVIEALYLRRLFAGGAA